MERKIVFQNGNESLVFSLPFQHSGVSLITSSGFKLVRIESSGLDQIAMLQNFFNELLETKSSISEFMYLVDGISMFRAPCNISKNELRLTINDDQTSSIEFFI